MATSSVCLVLACALALVAGGHGRVGTHFHETRISAGAVTEKTVLAGELVGQDRVAAVVDGELRMTVDGEDFKFVELVDRSELTSGPSQFYAGTVEGYPGSEVELFIMDAGLSATIRLQRRDIQVVTRADGTVHVTEIDPSKVGEEDVDPELDIDVDGELPRLYRDFNEEHVSVEADAGNISSSRSADTNVIDLVVFYTANARIGQGGVTGIEALVTMMEGDINPGYVNTGLATRVRVVYRGEVDYDENSQSSWSTHLNRFRLTSDGFMDDVHAIRTQYGGDACVLIITPTTTTSAGIGYVNSGFTTAFSVSHSSYVASTTGAHELGHNLGCWHDRTTDPSDRSPFDYARGYANAPAQQVTLMSYRCSGCMRVSVHASPNAFNGVVLGDVDNDCARRITERTPVMSGFSPCVTATPTPSPLPTTPEPTTAVPTTAPPTTAAPTTAAPTTAAPTTAAPTTAAPTTAAPTTAAPTTAAPTTAAPTTAAPTTAAPTTAAPTTAAPTTAVPTTAAPTTAAPTTAAPTTAAPTTAAPTTAAPTTAAPTTAAPTTAAPTTAAPTTAAPTTAAPTATPTVCPVTSLPPRDNFRCRQFGPSILLPQRRRLIVTNNRRPFISVYIITTNNTERRITRVRRGQTRRIRAPKGTVFRLKRRNNRRCVLNFRLCRNIRVRFGRR